MKRVIVFFIVFFSLTGISLSQSGWVMQYSNINIFYGINFLNINTGIAVGDEIICRTTNGGSNWELFQSANSYFRAAKFINSNIVIACGYSQVARSSDGGLNWQLAGELLDMHSIASFGNTVLIGCTDLKILRSTNTGVNWSSIQLPSNFMSRIIKGLCYSGPDTCFAVSEETSTWGHGQSFQGRIWKSINDGLNWTEYYRIEEGPLMKDVFFVNSNSGFASTDMTENQLKFCYTSNGGLNWIENSSYQHGMNSIYFTSFDTGYAGVYGGYTALLAKTTDHGQNWVTQFELQGSGGYSCEINSVYFANNSRGWFCGYKDGTGGVIYNTTNAGGPLFLETISNTEPLNFSLHQNYPNPFNPSTKIKFDMPKLSNAKLIIYDVLGREVATIVNEQLKPGSYEVEWDGSNYASGIYFYQLITEGAERSPSVQTKRMVLIK